MRKCNVCEYFKELNLKNFHAVGRNNKYFSNTCKSCINNKSSIRRKKKRKLEGKVKFSAYNKENKTKRCANCLFYFSYDEMCKNASEYLGIGAYCRLCHSKRMTAIMAQRKSKFNGVLISQDEYNNLLDKYHHKCGYCFCEVISGKNLNWDHHVPIFLNGANVIENIVPSCVNCNSSKSKKSPESFIESEFYLSKISLRLISPGKKLNFNIKTNV
jgi:HNH endonuclease